MLLLVNSSVPHDRYHDSCFGHVKKSRGWNVMGIISFLCSTAGIKYITTKKKRDKIPNYKIKNIIRVNQYSHQYW